MRLDTKSSKRGGSFKYLESIIQVNKEIDNDVTHPIGARWRNEGSHPESCHKKVPPT